MITRRQISQFAAINEKASVFGIENAENGLHIAIPDQLRKLWSLADGFSLNGGLLVYSAEDIIERNRTWEVSKYASDYLAIGDTGGGRVICLSGKPQDRSVYAVDSGSLTPSEMVKLADDLESWLTLKCRT